MTAESGIRIFKARRSVGVISLSTVAALMAILVVPMFHLVGPHPLAWVTLAMFGGVGLWALLLALWLPGLRYEAGPDALVIRLGPVSRTIPYASINQIERRDLTLAAVSMALNIVGASVGRVTYAGLGQVSMYSTAMLKDVMIVTTTSGRVGITPEREDEFVELTRARMHKS